MVMQHTPGPWYWSDGYRTRDGEETWSLIGKDGFGILSCDAKCNSPHETRPADARLIEVVPELLEALDHAVKIAEGEQAGTWDDVMVYRALIRKAKGEKP